MKGKKFKIRVKLFRRDPERNDMESAALQISLKCSSKYPKIVEVEYIVGSISRKVKDAFDGDTLDFSYKDLMKELEVRGTKKTRKKELIVKMLFSSFTLCKICPYPP